MSGWYNKGKHGVLSGSINWVTDPVLVVMLTQEYVFDPDHTFLSDILAFEAGAPGVTRLNLTNKTITQNNAADRVEFGADDIIWPLLNVGIVQGHVYVKETAFDNTSPLIAFVNTGGYPKTIANVSHTIKHSAGGVLQGS